jgi:hypothetical protein
MAHTPNEHIIMDEQLVMFTDKCQFLMFIKSKAVKYAIKVWIAAYAKNFNGYNMQL